jgi:hypothetical protein
MRIIGVDLALRNSAYVILNENGSFIDCGVVTSSARDYKDEKLLEHNSNKILSLLSNEQMNENFVILEGLSFNSITAFKDLIAGNYWHIRMELYSKKCKCYTVPAASWRAKLFSEEQKIFLSNYRKENKTYGDKLKVCATQLVPLDVQKIFKEYLLKSKLHINFLYDLSDAYCIALYKIRHFDELK